MSRQVLCVDDDLDILEAYQRRLSEQFDLQTAATAEEGLALIENSGPFAAVVADNRMPGMGGVQFLARVRERAPHTVRMMLTAYADLQTTIDAVNEGNIFRFLSKPCPPDAMAKALSAALDQYRLVMAEKQLLEQTLKGSVHVLTQVLSLVNPLAFGRAQRVRRLVEALADGLGVEQRWQLDIAAMLSHLGCVTVPEPTLERAYRGLKLSPEESRVFQNHSAVAADLLRNIPRLDAVSEMIAYQGKRFDGSGFPAEERRGTELPLGSRILKVALDFDRCESNGFSPVEALKQLKQNAADYDRDVLRVLEIALAGLFELQTSEVTVAGLCDGMVLAQDIHSCDGKLLVAKGHEVTASLRSRLSNFSSGSTIRQPILVFTQTCHTKDL